MATTEEVEMVRTASESDDVTSQEGIHHVVGPRDSLGSIAAGYDLTPSQLVQINKLNSRFIYPGQKLLVKMPPAPKTAKQAKITKMEDSFEESDIFDNQFLRLSLRHMTDGRGIIKGSLLWTPKSFMFNPNPADPLVEETEFDKYQLIAPMELVLNVTLFIDYFKFECFTDPEGSIYYEDKYQDKESHDPNETFYLRLVMGKRIGSRLPRTTPIMSYGEQTLQSEYWFLFRGADKARNLYKFINTWFANIYGAIDLLDIDNRGLEIIDSDCQILEDEADNGICHRDKHKKMIEKSFEMNELFIPELLGGESEIFDESLLKNLLRALPPRTDGHDLQLLFSSTLHGFSLKSLYRKMPPDLSEAIVIIIKDIDGDIFGAYLSSAPRISEHFVGTGESFIFNVDTKGLFHVFKWSGENEYFVKGNPNSLVIGASDGNYGIWLDEDLNNGRTQKCKTFDNPILTKNEDFIIKSLECWAFVL